MLINERKYRSRVGQCIVPASVIKEFLRCRDKVVVGAIDDAIQKLIGENESGAESLERRYTKRLDRLIAAKCVECIAQGEVCATLLVVDLDAMQFGLRGFGSRWDTGERDEGFGVAVFAARLGNAWSASWASIRKLRTARFVIRSCPQYSSGHRSHD